MSISVSGYRRLLRSATTLFKRDQFALSNAKTQLKMEFLKNKSVTDSDELSALFRGIEEVDEMLRFNVVQGTLNENGNYGVGFTPEQLVTIEAGQGDPNGPELSVPDSSLLGRPIKIDKCVSPKKQ